MNVDLGPTIRWIEQTGYLSVCVLFTVVFSREISHDPRYIRLALVVFEASAVVVRILRRRGQRLHDPDELHRSDADLPLNSTCLE